MSKLISITPSAETIMVYCARVSSPHQDSPKIEGLLAYCIRHKHWSVFETATMTIEITTSRAIAAQMLRHRSFCFQEFSQRYAEVQNAIVYEARSQDVKNRQNSIDDLSEETKGEWKSRQEHVHRMLFDHYQWALESGIAKECARMILPLSTETRLYMTGSVRSWIHYLDVRLDPSTQLEHRDVALPCKEIFISQLPLTAKALGWVNE